MKMTSAILLVIGVPALAIGSFAWYRYDQRKQWIEARLRTVDALNRAYEYRDAGVLLYEPRWKDFEVAADELQRLSLNEFDKADAQTLRICGDDLTQYRKDAARAGESIALARDSSPTLARKFADNARRFLDLQREADKTFHECVK
jgi:hypothetical protein